MKGNLLKISALKKKSEWCDKDRVLLYACFQILVDFLEKERPEQITDFKHNREQRKHWKELQALYRYWKKDRPAMEKESARELKKAGLQVGNEGVPPTGARSSSFNILVKNQKAFDRHNHLYEKIHRLDDEMLLRLIKIRHHLWC